MPKLRKFPTEQHLREFTGDIFGYKELSKKILDDVLLKMELPNCFGLYGNWGSGKSTMIHYMLNHLKAVKLEKYKKIQPIYFEPWKYEYSSAEDLLYALLAEIKKQSKLKKINWKKIQTSALTIGSRFLRVLDTAASPFTYGIQPSDVIDPKKISEDMEYWENFLYKKHEKWVDEIDTFKTDFQKLITDILTKLKKEKLIIFIDDLDRCLPDNAVKLLEAIKNFLSVDNTLFVLAIDKRVISEMIEKKYGLHYGYGDEYLMKIIQYNYELPQNNTESIVKQILTSYGIKSEENQLKYINTFMQKFIHEPRKVKHYLHYFAMNLILSKTANSIVEEDTFKNQLQYFFVASYLHSRYPKIFIPGDNLQILKYLRDCANIQTNPSRQNNYSLQAEQNTSISVYDRKQLEEIMLTPINLSDKIIDINQLNTAFHNIKK